MDGYPKMLRRRMILGSKSFAKTGRWDLEQRTSQFKHGYFITVFAEYLKFKLK